MYLNTHRSLLSPIYSLLVDPFNFTAHESIEKLKDKIAFFDKDLLVFAAFYDEERKKLKLKLSNICYKSESHYKCHLDEDVCFQDINILPSDILNVYSIKVQNERLYDYLKLKKEGDFSLDLNDHEYMEVLNFFRMNELLSLCISGNVKVRMFNKKMVFSPMGSQAKKEFYSTWFARYIETSSNLSFIKSILEILKLSKGRIGEEILYYVFERVFSLKPAELPKEALELACVKTVLNCLRIILFSMYYFENNNVNNIDVDELSKELNISSNDIKTILSLQRSQLVSEQFISERNNRLYVNFIMFIKCIRSFFDVLAKDFGEDSIRDSLIGGKCFEEYSIKKLISCDSKYQERYIIFDGINRGDVKIENELDVEYILYDKKVGFYYFIQTKYSIFGERSFFDGEVKQIQKDILKGLKQLRSAKSLFKDGKLMSVLKNIGIEQATLHNSCFVLLHNIPQLDYKETNDKIALYDWGSFKNLLNNGECVVNNDSVYRLDKNIVLNEPYKVIETLLSDHKVYSSIKENIEINHKIINRFSISDKELILVGLGL